MKTRTAHRSRASSDEREENACFTHSEVTSVENTRLWGYLWLAEFKIRFLLIPQMFSADAAGDLPDGEHHHAAGKVHHGQGVPTEGGADEAGVPDPAAQRGAVQGHAPVQVSGGGRRGRRGSLELPGSLGLENGPSTNQDVQADNATGHWVGAWGSGGALDGPPTAETAPLNCSPLI